MVVVFCLMAAVECPYKKGKCSLDICTSATGKESRACERIDGYMSPFVSAGASAADNFEQLGDNKQAFLQRSVTAIGVLQAGQYVSRVLEIEPGVMDYNERAQRLHVIPGDLE